MHFKNCKQCNNSYTTKELRSIFCSRSCSAKFNNKNTPHIKKSKVNRICDYCKNIYLTSHEHRSKKYCPVCVKLTFAFTHKDLTLQEYWNRPSVKNKHPSWKNAHIRGFNRSWNKELTAIPCIICGYKKHVELCHIKDVADFPPTATLGEVNNPKNILPLCRNHHWEFDNSLIDPSDLLKISKYIARPAGVEPA